MKINKSCSGNALLLTSALLVAVALTACKSHVEKAATPVVAADTLGNIVIRKSPNDDRLYKALLLPNKLQVVLISDPSLENSAASLAVGVGSAQDPDQQLGLAHYLEHMLFLGTQKYPIPDSFMEFVQTNAGYTNAFTAYDKTNYMFQLNAEKFDEALDRFSDYFKAPTLDPQYADKERNAVNSEWSMYHGQDNWILQELDGVTANPANPHSRFSVGNLETLVDKKDSRLYDELKSFYNRYYSANNMRLTLVGKQSIPELTALVEKYFSAIPNKNIARPTVTVPGIAAAQMGKIIHYQSIKDMKKIYVDFPLKNNKDQWRVKPNEFVNNLITSEEAGTLGEQLRKSGLVNGVTAQVNPDEYGADGYLRIQADLTDVGLKNPDQVIASVFAYIDLIKKQGVNEIYFRELKAMQEKDFEHAPKKDPIDQAVDVTMDQFDLPVENLLDADFVYDHFDPQAIHDVLAQLNPANARIWFINKNENAEKTIPYFGGKYSVSDITAQDQSRWSELAAKLQFTLPPPNNLFTDKPADIVSSEYLKPHQVTSQKGVEAFLVQPEFYREDKGMLVAEINVDFAQKNAKNVVLSQLLSDIYKTQNTSLIDRASRASLVISIEPGATNSQDITVSGYTTKHEELLNQLLKDFIDLKITDKDFVEALDRYKQNKINARKAPPFRQLFAHARRLAGNAKWTDAELLAAAGKITVSDVNRYHQQVKANALIRIFAFGNYTAPVINRIALSAAQQFPAQRLPEQRQVAKYITPKIGNNLAYHEVIEQTDSALLDAYFGDKKSDDERAQLVVLQALFGNLLFSQLRTNEQMGYVVGSSPFPVDDYPGFAIYVQSTNTDLVGIKTRLDKFRSDFLTQLKTIEPDQIEQIKKAEAAIVLQKPTDFYAEAKRYSADFWAAHYDFTARERYLAALEKVNKENLVSLYEKLLVDKKNMNLLIQLKGTTFASKPFAK